MSINICTKGNFPEFELGYKVFIGGLPIRITNGKYS